MITILGNICEKLDISFNFLNRDHSPSNKTDLVFIYVLLTAPQDNQVRQFLPCRYIAADAP